MTNADNTLALFQLNQLRASIDNMDAILVHTLAERHQFGADCQSSDVLFAGTSSTSPRAAVAYPFHAHDFWAASHRQGCAWPVAWSNARNCSYPLII